MTGPTATKPPVPQMRTSVTGQSYGGAYWNPAEYEIVLDAPITDDDKFVVSLEDTAGHSVYRLELTRDQALALRDVAANTESTSLVEGIDGLEQTTVWTLGDDTSAYAQISDLGEIGAWLNYALSINIWHVDFGDTWSY